MLYVYTASELQLLMSLNWQYCLYNSYLIYFSFLPVFQVRSLEVELDTGER